MRDQKVGDGHECSLSVFHGCGAADDAAVVGGNAAQLLASVVGALIIPPRCVGRRQRCLLRLAIPERIGHCAAHGVGSASRNPPILSNRAKTMGSLR
jgi:hypothetical protein